MQQKKTDINDNTQSKNKKRAKGTHQADNLAKLGMSFYPCLNREHKFSAR